MLHLSGGTVRGGDLDTDSEYHRESRSLRDVVLWENVKHFMGRQSKKLEGSYAYEEEEESVEHSQEKKIKIFRTLHEERKVWGFKTNITRKDSGKMWCRKKKNLLAENLRERFHTNTSFLLRAASDKVRMVMAIANFQRGEELRRRRNFLE